MRKLGLNRIYGTFTLELIIFNKNIFHNEVNLALNSIYYLLLLMNEYKC